jgi:hypothetical protein
MSLLGVTDITIKTMTVPKVDCVLYCIRLHKAHTLTSHERAHSQNKSYNSLRFALSLSHRARQHSITSAIVGELFHDLRAANLFSHICAFYVEALVNLL